MKKILCFKYKIHEIKSIVIKELEYKKPKKWIIENMIKDSATRGSEGLPNQVSLDDSLLSPMDVSRDKS